MAFKSGKIYSHSIGLSCCFRQWRTSTHCSYLHGYALQVELEFEREDGGLDMRNWVMGFGDLKPVKKWLEDNFDHKTLIAADDPELEFFKKMDEHKVIKLNVVEHVGVEMFAKMIFDATTAILDSLDAPAALTATLSEVPEVAVTGAVAATAKIKESKVFVTKVTVREHEGNWASYSK